MCEILSQFLCEIKFALLLDPHTYFIKTVGEFVCNVCGKQFMAKNALYDHNWGVHTDLEVESLCNDCDKIFRNKTKLAYHIRVTHREKDSFYCDVKSGEIDKSERDGCRKI